MGYGHSMDLRRRIIEAVQAGASAREAARRFAVSPASAIKDQPGQAAGAELGGATLARLGAVRSLGDNHICSRPAPSWLDGTDGAGWGDQRCWLQSLCGADTGSEPTSWRPGGDGQPVKPQGGWGSSSGMLAMVLLSVEML